MRAGDRTSAERKGLKKHPAIVHLHIHLLEMSNEPERAAASAAALATMCPDAGHMNHMPGMSTCCAASTRRQGSPARRRSRQTTAISPMPGR